MEMLTLYCPFLQIHSIKILTHHTYNGAPKCCPLPLKQILIFYVHTWKPLYEVKLKERLLWMFIMCFI